MQALDIPIVKGSDTNEWKSIVGYVNFEDRELLEKVMRQTNGLGWSLQPAFRVIKKSIDENGAHIYEEVEVMNFSLVPDKVATVLNDAGQLVPANRETCK
jgi:hypothetical protein